MRREIDFSKIVKDLNAAGITCGQLSRDTDRVVSAIHALKSRRVHEPAWPVGDYLIRKYIEVFQMPAPKLSNDQ